MKTTEQRNALRRVMYATLLVALSIPASVPAAAQSKNAVRLDVRRGFDGFTRGFSPNPLTVVIESDEFFGGYIEVLAPSGPGGNARYRQAVEVPGGSRKTIHLVTPRSSITTIVAVNAKGVPRATAGIPGENVLRSGESLIGMVGAEEPRIGSIDVPIVGESAKVVAVPAAFLSLGSAALGALSHLVVDGAVVATLSPQQRSAIEGFAALGGEVVVAAGTPEDLAPLPGDLAVKSGRIRTAAIGSGRITGVLAPPADAGWDAGGSLWEQTIRPVNIARWGDGNRNQILGSALRETGGFRRPTLGWLLFFVLAYVALVGPVNFMVLARMRRRELAWLTIPGISVLFAIGAYVAGQGFRDVAVLQGVGIRVFGGGGEQSEIVLGAVPRRADEATIELRGGWTAEPHTLVSVRAEGQRIEFGRDRITATFDLATGEVGTLVGHRTIPGKAFTAGRVAVRLTELQGTVTNPTGFALQRPRVFVGPASTGLGPSMAPGDSREVALDLFNTAGREVARSFEFGGFEGGFGFGNDGSFAEPPSIYRRAGQIAGLGEPGRAFLTGWAPLAAMRDELGIGEAKGDGLIMVPIELDGAASAMPAQTVELAVVGTDGQLNQDGGGFQGKTTDLIQNARRTVLRFGLPTAEPADRLRLTGEGPNPFGEQRRFTTRGKAGGDVARNDEDLPAPQFKPLQILPNDGDEPVPLPEPPAAIGPDFGGVGDMNAQAFDFDTGRWVDLAARDDGSVVFRSGGKHRYVDGRALYIRVLSDFGRTMSASIFTLEGITT